MKKSGVHNPYSKIYNAMTNASEKIRQADLAGLEIIHYPDPRLTEVSAPLGEVDGAVAALVDRMFELMFEGNGVGLAAPQVGLTVRLFVTSPTFDPADRRVYINPRIISAEGEVESEEGCLSVPGINCTIKRSAVVTVRAVGLDGEAFEETADELAARVIQHENDHLDGLTIVSRMGTVARMTHRRQLKELQTEFDER